MGKLFLLALPLLAVTFYSCTKDDATMSVDNSYIYVNAESGIYTINLTSNSNWEISNIPNWISFSVTKGSGNESIKLTYEENSSIIPREHPESGNAGTQTISIEIEENDSYTSSRVATILILAGTMSIERTLSQSVKSEELYISPSSLTRLGGYLKPSTGGNFEPNPVFSINVTSNCKWTANAPSRYRMIPSSGSAGTTQVTVIIQNWDNLPTNESITFRTDKGVISRVFDVTIYHVDP